MSKGKDKIRTGKAPKLKVSRETIKDLVPATGKAEKVRGGQTYTCATGTCHCYR